MDNIAFSSPKILVIGAGGAGINVLNKLIAKEIKNVNFLAIDSNPAKLSTSKSANKLDIGHIVTNGRGAGGDSKVGLQCMETHKTELDEHLKDIDLVFLTCGMGGGTGSGSLPVIAEVCKEKNITSIAVVTTPFNFEGRKRAETAINRIESLESSIDTIVEIPNSNLLSLVDKRTSMVDAFNEVDEVLCTAVANILELIEKHGVINLDFADITKVLEHGGKSLIGVGYGQYEENKALEAVKQAIYSPLLKEEITGAEQVILSFAGNSSLSTFEVNEAARLVHDTVSPDANIIFGLRIDDSLGEKVKAIVIATGLNGTNARKSGFFPIKTDRFSNQDQEIGINFTRRNLHSLSL